MYYWIQLLPTVTSYSVPSQDLSSLLYTIPWLSVYHLLTWPLRLSIKAPFYKSFCPFGFWHSSATSRKKEEKEKKSSPWRNILIITVIIAINCSNSPTRVSLQAATAWTSRPRQLKASTTALRRGQVWDHRPYSIHFCWYADWQSLFCFFRL